MRRSIPSPPPAPVTGGAAVGGCAACAVSEGCWAGRAGQCGGSSFFSPGICPRALQGRGLVRRCWRPGPGLHKGPRGREGPRAVRRRVGRRAAARRSGRCTPAAVPAVRAGAPGVPFRGRGGRAPPCHGVPAAPHCRPMDGVTRPGSFHAGDRSNEWFFNFWVGTVRKSPAIQTL